MAQFAASAGSRSSADTVSVADILSRNAPAPVKILGTQTTPPLAVGNLLRREGRVPADEVTAVTAAGPAAPRMALRRGALAAGAVIAAGSAFGFTLLNGTVPVADQQALAGTSGPHAGQGLLDDTAPTAPTPVVISPTAASRGLDAGTHAPTAWTPVAFPGGTTAPGGATRDTTTAIGTTTPTSSAIRTPRTPAAGIGDAGAPPATPAAGGSTGNPATTGPNSTGTGGGAGHRTPAAGSPSTAPGPVAGAVNGLGNTVPTLGGAVGSVVAPAATTVGGLVGGLL